MLVLSRYVGESICIDDDLFLTVALAGTEFVELSVGSGDQSNSRLLTLGLTKNADIAPEVNVTFVMIREGKIRLGITAPRGTKIERVGSSGDV